MTSVNPHPRIIKICLVGSENTGKTNIRRVIIGKRFKRNISPTIGSDFSFNESSHDGQKVKSMIWDLSGNVKYKPSRSLYLQGMQGCLLIFDITNENSLKQLEDWITDIEQNTSNKAGIPMIVVGNKSDLIPISDHSVSETQITDFVQKLNERFNSKIKVDYIITSASTGENVQKAFSMLIANVQKWLNTRNNQ